MRSFLALFLAALTSTPFMWAHTFFGMQKHIRNEKPPTVFIGGAVAYGDNTFFNDLIPSFGFKNNVPRMLETAGYECYVTSPGSFNSSWDRACIVFAELTGGVVDYGKAHSEKHGHARYGRAFAKPLVPDWNASRPVNLFGDSQGGQTAYLFASMMAIGNAEERAATTDGSLSPLFRGGYSHLIHSVTTFGGPLNGANALPRFLAGDWVQYALTPFFMIPLPVFQYTGMKDVLSYCATGDNCLADFDPQRAIEYNKMCDTVDDIYYFAYTVSDSAPIEGTENQMPNINNLWHAPFGAYQWLLGLMPGTGYGAFSGMTYEYEGGSFTIDDTWKLNDGPTSAVACRYPFGQPEKPFDPKKIEKGVWQWFPNREGYVHGFYSGFDWRHDTPEVYDFYLQHLMILDQTY